LLDSAHQNLVKAYHLTNVTGDDAVMIQAVDCLALAYRSGRLYVALDAIAKTTSNLAELNRSAAALRREAVAWHRAATLPPAPVVSELPSYGLIASFSDLRVSRNAQEFGEQADEAESTCRAIQQLLALATLIAQRMANE
jgi:hypothetical protein